MDIIKFLMDIKNIASKPKENKMLIFTFLLLCFHIYILFMYYELYIHSVKDERYKRV